MAILGGVTIAAVDYGLRQNVGTPIWCGLPLIAFAGFFGIMSGCKKSHGIAIAYLVMSILACLGDISVLGLSVTAIVVQIAICDETDSDFSAADCSKTGGGVGTGVYATLVILALLEFFVSIFGASLTCTPVCYTEPAKNTSMKYESEQRLVVSGHPQNVAAHSTHAATGQAQSASSAQQGQLPQTRAPPTGEQQYQELIR
ncbi:uncharacterized protein LOC119729927 [Patiria miniata]|uniref:Uncharacterized protein n=1 Tax=Patiria miniata TaxID=46514 RepID=A0A914A5F3_PATMI|nr:uncharacterized protein LOC119729927 [Patiria miniata]